MNSYQVISHPVSTEKAIRLMESQNKLVFVVHKKATKAQVAAAFQEMFKAKVVDVKTYITPQGVKKAYIRLSPETPALDVATQLGLM